MMSNHDAESYNDLRISGSMRLGRLCRVEAMIPQFLAAKESKCMGVPVVYNSSNFLLKLCACVYSCLYLLYLCKYPYTCRSILY